MQLVTSGAPPNAPTHSTKERKKNKFIRIQAVENLTGMGKSTLYKMMADGDFPKNIKLTRRLSVWDENSVLDWIDAKAAKAA